MRHLPRKMSIAYSIVHKVTLLLTQGTSKILFFASLDGFHKFFSRWSDMTTLLTEGTTQWNFTSQAVHAVHDSMSGSQLSLDGIKRPLHRALPWKKKLNYFFDDSFQIILVLLNSLDQNGETVNPLYEKTEQIVGMPNRWRKQPSGVGRFWWVWMVTKNTQGQWIHTDSSFSSALMVFCNNDTNISQHEYLHFLRPG